MPRPRTKLRLTAESRLTLVRAKIERAKQNLLETEFIIFTAHGYVPGKATHIKSRKRAPGQFPTYKIPFDALTAAGDVVHNLRGALDHLAYQLTHAHRPRTTEDQFRQIYFPISKNKAAYEKAVANAYKKFFGAEAIKILDGLKPYKDGNEALWRLHQLNNFSKHRLLLSMERYVICTAPWHTQNGVQVPYLFKFGRPQFSGIYGRPKVHDYVLITGQESLIKLRPGRREALLPTLHYLVEVVDRIVNEFLPVLG